MIRKIDWSSLWKKEDWWAVWLGFLIIGIAIIGFLAWVPKVNSWTTNIGDSIKLYDLLYFALLYVFLSFLTLIGILFIEKHYSLAKHFLGFAILFLLTLLSFVIAKHSIITTYGLEYVIWALLLGLIISNLMSVPNWLHYVTKTELFIKVGLVLLGAEILFNELITAGPKAIFQALLVVFVVWYVAYFTARKLGLDREFSTVLASGVSICGVSAAIATGGAIKADPKKVGHVIGLVLLTAIIMLFTMPPLAKFLNLSEILTGAWIGGTIDTTPAVVAAGALYGSEALKIAAVTKMAQNVLIGVVAFLIALYWTFKVKNNTTEKASVVEVWYRFPKFVLGFILASILFSLILIPLLGTNSVKIILGNTKIIREWFFALAFISIGIETKFHELISIEKGKPLVAYVLAQLFNIAWTLLIAYIVWIII